MHQVSARSASRETIWGIGIPELFDHAERHSASNTSSNSNRDFYYDVYTPFLIGLNKRYGPFAHFGY